MSSLVSTFQQHYGELLRFLTRRTGDPELAADVAQDTYLRLATMPEPEAKLQDPRAYLFRIAANLAIDRLRRDGRLPDALPEGIEEVLADPAPGQEQRLLAQERLRLLDQALEQLPPNARLALLYSRMDGVGHARIAARLGVSESMVAKYIASALRHCRDRLRQAGVPPP